MRTVSQVSDVLSVRGQVGHDDRTRQESLVRDSTPTEDPPGRACPEHEAGLSLEMNRIPEPSPPSSAPRFPECAHRGELARFEIVYVEGSAEIMVRASWWCSGIASATREVTAVQHGPFRAAPAARGAPPLCASRDDTERT